MAIIYTKINETTVEISEDIVKKQQFALGALVSNSTSIQLAIDATRESLDKLTAQKDRVDNSIAKARALGIKTQEEINAETI